MKNRFLLLCCLVFVVAVASGCGSSSSSDSSDSETAAQKMADSWAGLQEILNSSAVAPCVANTSTECTCSGGGTVSVSGTTTTVSSCKSTGGLTYDGSLTGAGTFSGTATTFGKCTSAVITNMTATSCGGLIVATCAGESTNCYPTSSSSSISVGTGIDALKTLDCTCSSSSSDGGGGGGGGGGETTTAQDALMASFIAFSSLEQAAAGSASYSCPGGGTITSTSFGASITAASCTDADGLVFTGNTMVSNSLQNGTLPVFGSCVDVVFDQVPAEGVCGGTVSGTCSNESATCSLTGTTGACTCS